MPCKAGCTVYVCATRRRLHTRCAAAAATGTDKPGCMAAAVYDPPRMHARARANDERHLLLLLLQNNDTIEFIWRDARS